MRAAMRMPNAAKQRELAGNRSNSRMSLNMSRDSGYFQNNLTSAKLSNRSKAGGSFL